MALDSLMEVVDADQAGRVPAGITALAEAARARHGEAVQAVLFYGSSLRNRSDDEGVADLYLLVDDYAKAHSSSISAFFNRVLPPNVYYLEIPFEGRPVRAKYAVVSLEQFKQRVGPGALHPYFWARFSQPTCILWSCDNTVRHEVRAALAQAVETMLVAAAVLMEPPSWAEPDAWWRRALAETYRTELRTESKGRGDEIISQDRTRYERAANAVLAAYPSLAETGAGLTNRWAGLLWWLRRFIGKPLSVLRLMKAAYTFSEGADYLAWKIQRHTGQEFDLTPWQRRHPILAGFALLWRLRRRGAVR